MFANRILSNNLRDMSFIISRVFSWDNKIINIAIEIPTLILMFNRHKQVEYPLVINLLHLLCGSSTSLKFNFVYFLFKNSFETIVSS